MIKNLIFDFGKVLVNHDLQPLLERHFGDDEVSLIGFLSDPEFINMCDRGIIPFEKMIDGAIKRYPEYSDAFTFFKDNYLEEITGEIEGMHVLLKKLKQSGFKLYGLTNWSDTIYRVMEKFDIFQLLHGVVISCEEHFIKPEKEIYLRLCDKYSLKPSECLFTDDRMVNVLGAKLQPVMVIALNEKIVRYQKRIGLQGYEGLPFGTYLIRINEKTFKIQLSK